MQRVPEEVVRQLDLVTAVQQEATTWRSLVPPEPWLPMLLSKTSAVVDWVSTRLRAGARNAPAAIVNTRKAGQGIRPVPVVGIGERIAYRAFTNLILQGIPQPARSVEDYRSFVTGPISFAFIGVTSPKLGDARLRYVAEADIAAFYQYVDHEILRQELEFQTGRVFEAGVLLTLLGEIQGSTFGIPQLLDPSDFLSEIYIRIMERDIVRRGVKVWRYNDDFRVGADTYAEAQNALERMSDAARGLGLVLSEHKTHISKFMTYLLRYLSFDVDDDEAQIDPNEADIEFTAYAGGDANGATDVALRVLARIDLASDDEDRIDLKNLRADDVRSLRLAIVVLTKNEEFAGLSHLVRLFLFVPSLTPRLGDYMIKASPVEVEQVSDAWDHLTQEHTDSLGEWQRIWLVYVARAAGILRGNPRWIEWLRSQLNEDNGLLHAEACLALAEIDAVSFEELDVAVRVRPEPLVPWYILGMKALADTGAVTLDKINAVKQTSPIYRILLEG